jgi:hypothetical protein
MKDIFKTNNSFCQRRNNAIEMVKQLILKDYSFNEIWLVMSRYFTKTRINEYYSIALDEIKSESSKK